MQSDATLSKIAFQSTPPHGGRHTIHFAAKPLDGFNPRPRTEGDPVKQLVLSLYMFQSTPPHGGRPGRSPARRFLSGFNPRPRTEGDRH